MRKINNHVTTFLLLIFLSLTSCTDWLDVNDDPNNPTNVDPENALAVAQVSVGGAIGGDLSIVGGLWSQQWTQSHVSNQYRTLDAYDLNPSDYNIFWNEIYAGGLNDLEVIKKGAEENGNWNLYLQAVCIQNFGFQILADFFDQIPYSEALKGTDKLNPSYDDGETVYAGLIASIDAALAKDFSSRTNTYIKSDMVFPLGNKEDQIGAWKQFAHTLKFKLLLRQSAVKTSVLEGLSYYVNNPDLLLSRHAAITQFIDEPNRSNFLYENNVRQQNTGGNLRLSRTIHSYLESKGDFARLNAYFIAGPGAGGAHRSLVQGNYEELTSVTCPSCISTANMTATEPFYFISTDEIYFMLAEAALLTGGDPVKIKSWYDAGVVAAYDKFRITFNTSLIGSGGVYAFPVNGSVAEKHEAIMVQKWLAMFKRGYESFFDQSRTGYPRFSAVPAADPNYIPGQLTYSLNGVTSGLFPKRLLFPATSSDVNSNAPARVPVTTKVWWMI